jgi:hypothetical protein
MTLDDIIVIAEHVRRETPRLEEKTTISQGANVPMFARIAPKKSEELLDLPSRRDEELAQISSNERRTAKKGQLPKLCQCLFETWKVKKRAMQALWCIKFADAPS